MSASGDLWHTAVPIAVGQNTIFTMNLGHIFNVHYQRKGGSTSSMSLTKLKDLPTEKVSGIPSLFALGPYGKFTVWPASDQNAHIIITHAHFPKQPLPIEPAWRALYEREIARVKEMVK